MILYKEPVAHILSLAIDWERTTVTDIVDEQWDKLLRELVRPIVVGAVGHDSRHAVGIVIGPYKVVRASLAGTVWRMRIILGGLIEEILAIGQVMLSTGSRGGERRLHPFRVRHLQGTIHLIGRDVVETLQLVPLRERLPIETGSLKQAQRTHHVGAGKGERILDGTVHMAFCCQVDDTIDLFLLHELVESLKIADIHPDELVVGLILHILQVGQITRIGQLVQVNDLILRILIHEKTYHMASNETCAACNDNTSFSHNLL